MAGSRRGYLDKTETAEGKENISSRAHVDIISALPQSLDPPVSPIRGNSSLARSSSSTVEDLNGREELKYNRREA
jgi:hypothetical protein